MRRGRLSMFAILFMVRYSADLFVQLGNAIHGPAPVLDDEDGQPGMNTAGMGMSMGMNFNPAMYPTGAFPWAGAQGQAFPGQPMFAPGVGLTPGFLMPPGAAQMDPSFMAAHHQAMLAAKQAYQIAVAQQALAAAGDEWERSSNVGGWPSAMAMGGMGMQMPQMGPNMGMGMMGMPSMMFTPPAAPASVYGGGSPGSVYGGGGGRPPMWTGTGSVYGESFGPSTTHAADRRRSTVPAQPGVAFPSSSSHGRLDQLRQPQQPSSGQSRQRTRTAPSGAPPPLLSPAPPMPGALRTPPSSWRTSQG